MIGRMTVATAVAIACAVAARWPAALRNRPRLWSRLVMALSRHGRACRHEAIADATHGLHDERIARIALDLAAQPIDLHVDGALAHRLAVAGQRLARHGLAGACGQDPQHFALAVGEADHLFAAAQFAARQMKHELPET